MSKVKIIIRKVASPYSEKNGWVAEFLEKGGRRFFVAEQFEKELTADEEQLARPLDIVHLIGYAYKFGKSGKFALSKTLKDFGPQCLDESKRIDAVRAELASVRKERNILAQLVADIALPLAQRKFEHDKTDEETKAEYASAVVKYDNRVKWATPKLDAFKKAVTRMVAVLEMDEGERAYFA